MTSYLDRSPQSQGTNDGNLPAPWEGQNFLKDSIWAKWLKQSSEMSMIVRVLENHVPTNIRLYIKNTLIKKNKNKENMYQDLLNHWK